MKFIEERKIEEIIKEYIDEDNTDYAVMIDGEWGSGKTYFVKNKLIPRLQDLLVEQEEGARKILYISLYGISQCDDIMKSIWINTLPVKNEDGKKNKFLGITSNIGKAVAVGGMSFLILRQRSLTMTNF